MDFCLFVFSYSSNMQGLALLGPVGTFFAGVAFVIGVTAYWTKEYNISATIERNINEGTLSKDDLMRQIEEALKKNNLTQKEAETLLSRIPK